MRIFTAFVSGFAAAAAATALTLAEITVKDGADFEALRAAVPQRVIYVGGLAYAALPESEAATFTPGGRDWKVVATAAAGEGFLVLPAGTPYDGPARASTPAGAGNRVYVMAAEDGAALAPIYAFNFLGALAAAPSGGRGHPAPLLDPAEANAVDLVSRERLMDTTTRLQDFYSRYVYYHGNADATSFLENEYREYPRMTAERQYFVVSGYGHSAAVANVIARLPGVAHPEQQIVVGSHFDSATFASLGNPDAPAPGADDNASGTAAVLECARILNTYAFERTVIFVAFNGEELGLYGSKAYADAARERGDDIRAMLNLDMVAYDSDADLDADAITDDASVELGDLLADKARLYTDIEMTSYPGNSPYSDQYYFWQNGYLAAWEFEGWNDYDPGIHSDQDTVDAFNQPYFADMTKIFVAATFDLARYTTAPAMGIIKPRGGEYADRDFDVTWWDVDADDNGRDAAISLYYAADNTGKGGTLLAEGIRQNDDGNRGSYAWDTSSLAAGKYYVYGVIADGAHPPYTATSGGPVYVVHGSRVVVYPNPVRRRDGRMEVTFDGFLPGDNLAVYDLGGNKIFERRTDGRHFTWDAQALAGGVYLYRVESDVTADAASGKFAVVP